MRAEERRNSIPLYAGDRGWEKREQSSFRIVLAETHFRRRSGISAVCSCDAFGNFSRLSPVHFTSVDGGKMSFGPNGSQRKGHVCLLDDDPSVLKATGRLLTSAVWAAESFTDPHAFLSYAHQHRPALVVLDIAMPVM